ncbi:MAG TPA: hypothetical protein VII47_13510, partial [Actinomycetota bacterium]
PSEVVDGGRGTCIDLALLVASCLEYVEIYPALVILKTHAFPAYWRFEQYHKDFMKVTEAAATAAVAGRDADRSSAPTAQRDGWYLDRSQYREILNAINSGRLVPLETTQLTQRGSFAEAIEEGTRNLGSGREFEAFMDIARARTDPLRSVTPLPIRRTEA